MPDPLILALTLLYLWNIVTGVAYVAGLVFLYQCISEEGKRGRWKQQQ